MHSGIFGESLSVGENLPISLTTKDWYIAIGKDDRSLSPEVYRALPEYSRIEKFPIIINQLFQNPRDHSVREYTLRTEFDLDLSRIHPGKEIAFFLSGIGESWSMTLNGEVILDRYFLKEKKIESYSFNRNSIITIPHDLLQKKNVLTIYIAGYTPFSFLTPNVLFGLRFSDGYYLDYEKKIRYDHSDLSVLLLNSIYVFFGLYHLFFFIKWPQKKYNLYFALFSLSISTYFLAFSSFLFETFTSNQIQFLMALATQPLALFSFILFLWEYFFPNVSYSRMMWYSIISNILIFVVYLFAKVYMYHSILYVWYFLAIPQLLFIVYLILKALREGSKDAISMASSTIVLLMVVVWEIMDTIIFHTGFRFLQYAYFAFILSLILILANRFIEINWETKILNIEITKQRDLFSKFVPEQFLEVLGKDLREEIALGDCKLEEVTIVFSDIRNFTSLSESMTPDENFRFINSYLSRMSPVIENNHGFIDKFIGDAIMSIFRTPVDALKASIEAFEVLEVFNQHRANSGYTPIGIGIGIHTGKVMMGTVGHKNRLSTTVIGDTVNLASRLESLTKKYHANIIISESTASSLPESFLPFIRMVDSVIVKGKSIPVHIYECYQMNSDSQRELKKSYNDKYETALLLKIEKDYISALKIFKEILEINPDDLLIRMYYDSLTSEVGVT